MGRFYGIAATLAAGWVLLPRSRLNPKGWVGVMCCSRNGHDQNLPETIAAGRAAIPINPAPGFQLIARKPVTDMARLSARQRSLAAGAELCTPMTAIRYPCAIRRRAAVAGNVSHWCEVRHSAPSRSRRTRPDGNKRHSDDLPDNRTA